MDRDHEEPAGPIVVLRIEAGAYVVSFDPPRAFGGGPRSFPDKDSAWGVARDLWSALRLGFRDETDGNTGRPSPRRSSQ